ncbi:MAG: discoidin domain-containing protein, partial [Planctomycetota bacterium]
MSVCGSAACLWAAAFAAGPAVQSDKPNVVSFPATEARFVRFVIRASSSGQPCVDELEVYGPEGVRNLALASDDAVATASSCLPGYAIHKIAHLNDGLYGNSHSWIAAGSAEEWAQIELPRAAKVARVIFSRDREGRYRDRLPIHFEVRLSLDGKRWKTVREVKARAARPAGRRRPSPAAPADLPRPFTWEGLLRYAFLCEQESWSRVDRSDAASRVLGQMEEMIARFSAGGLDVAEERAELAELRARYEALPRRGDPGEAAERALFLEARLAKRRLFFRDPDLVPLRKVLFVRRHPYEPSHNYSVILDGRFRGGGGVCVLEIPRRGGRLVPAEGRLTVLFDAEGGMARDPMADFDASRVYFAHRPSAKDYWHVHVMNADGTGLRQLTDGPFHDYYPCPLPDGGIAFISTRCKSRFLCWRPQAFVLFRMEADGSEVRPLSCANLSEWAPSVMTDGRIVWTRSEYLDKGANYGHTLWAIRPDGTHPELIYGNNTRNCCIGGRQVPGTSEILCTLISHFGDLNGPVALVDLARGRFDPGAAAIITPDVSYNYDRGWPRRMCFRDPVPVSRDHFLVSH